MAKAVPLDWPLNASSASKLGLTLEASSWRKPAPRPRARQVIAGVKRFMASLSSLRRDQMAELAIKRQAVETSRKILDDKRSCWENGSKVRRGGAPEILSVSRKIRLSIMVPVQKLFVT